MGPPCVAGRRLSAREHSVELRHVGEERRRDEHDVVEAGLMSWIGFTRLISLSCRFRNFGEEAAGMCACLLCLILVIHLSP